MQKINVMVVDDSAIVRGLIVRRLSQEPNLHVEASLANGEMAVNAIRHHHNVDIVVLDIEMPVMDGMTALPQILALSPKIKVIMASTLTLRNADISLRALEIGAADYIPKPSLREDKDALEKFYRELIEKINALAPEKKISGTVSGSTVSSARSSTAGTAAGAATILTMRGDAPAPHSATMATATVLPSAPPLSPPKALAIASSTGGPQALLEIFRSLKGELVHVPVFITQHMPKTFTKILADHITQACGRDCHEAIHGEQVQNGKIYLAPGDFHMVPRQRGVHVVIELNQDAEVNFCRPAADPMIDGLVHIYGKHLMLVVLTGMGQDGLNGAKKLHEAGGTVVAQDKESCVVWGMPRAVTEQGICRAVLPLHKIPDYLKAAYAAGGRA